MTKLMVWMGPVLAVSLLAGCKKKDGENKPAEKVVADKAAEPPKKVGLEDPTNDPKIVAAVKQVLADCGKTMDEMNGDKKRTIEACDKFDDDFGAMRLQLPKSDVTYVNLLEDPDVRVRALGVEGLHRWAPEWKNDKALAGRVVEGLKKEKAPSPIDHEWAQRVASIPTETGVDDQIKALAMDPNTSMDVKAPLMAWWPSPAGYELVKANAASTDAVVVNAVVQGYSQQYKDHSDEACAYWAAHLETPDAVTNEMAIGRLTGGSLDNKTRDTESEDNISGTADGPSDRNDKRCTAEQLTTALDLIEKKFAAGASDDWMPRALGFLANDKLSPPPVKERAVKDLKAMVEKKNYFPGQAALRALAQNNDPAMVKYAQKFAKDPNLKDTVDGIVQASKEKKK